MAPKKGRPRSSKGAAAVEEVTPASAVDAQPPPEKKLKVDPEMNAVIQAIEGTDLPSECRSMLVALVLGCLGTPPAERQEPQTLAVNMLEGALLARRESLRQAVIAQDAKLADLEASSAGLISQVAAAEAELGTRVATVEEKNKVLAAATQEMLAAKRCVTEAQDAQKSADAAIVEAAAEKQTLAAALVECFKPLKDGTSESDQQAKAHVSKLVPLVKRIKLDESLAQALPSSCCKRPDDRGPFDKMVVEQLEIMMEEKVKALELQIQEAEPAAVERKAAIEAANKRADIAKDAQHQAAAEVGAAQAAQREQQTFLEEAKAKVERLKPAYEEASKARDEKRGTLEAFESVSFNTFVKLRDGPAPAPVEEDNVGEQDIKHFSEPDCAQLGSRPIVGAKVADEMDTAPEALQVAVAVGGQ